MLTRQQPLRLKTSPLKTETKAKTSSPRQDKAKTLTNMTKTRQDQDTAIPNKTKARLAPRCRLQTKIIVTHVFSLT